MAKPFNALAGMMGKLEKPPAPATTISPQALDRQRAQQHPRIVNEPGEQTYYGPKPTKKLHRGGERIT